MLCAGVFILTAFLQKLILILSNSIDFNIYSGLLEIFCIWYTGL